jgi:4-phytase/acid phosphatase/peptide/nickel transport system substrate-binding protein
VRHLQQRRKEIAMTILRFTPPTPAGWHTIRRVWRGIYTVTVLLLGLLVSPVTGAQHGGTLIFGADNEFAGFETLTSASRLAINGSIAANTIMEPLFRMDAQQNLIPVLGLTARESADGKLWTFTLRRGVTFHDGTPFNADAVVQHWSRLLDPANKYRGRRALSVLEAVEKADAYAVNFRLKHRWLPFLNIITGRRTLANLMPSPQSVDQGTQNRHPVGTGPFMFKEWKPGDRFVVVRNPNYWQKDRPFLDQIVFKPLPDLQTRFASLKTGQLDMIWMDRGNLLKKAAGDPSLRVYHSEENGAEIIILNTSKPPLDNVKLRRALAHAHNQSSHVKMVYQDSVPEIRHPFGKDCECAQADYREYDPQLAKGLVPQNTLPVEIELLHSNSKRGRDTGEISQQHLKAIGITLKPMGLEFSPVIKKVISGQYTASTWRISSRPDLGPALLQMLHSKSRGNFSHYKSPEMDRLLVAQRMATDPIKRQALLCQIAKMINTDVPILYRGGMRNHVIARKQIEGIGDMQHGIIDFRDVWLLQ